MLPLLTFLAALQLSSAYRSERPKTSSSLFILDEGVGHRSTPVTRWRTSIRSTTTQGTNATIIQQLGPENNPDQPIGAYSLAYSPSTSSLYSATGEGIIRTDIDGSNPKILITEDTIMSVTVAEKEGKIYYSTLTEGLIKRAELDGSNVEVVRNVSQGINLSYGASYTPAYFYAGGVLVDEEKGWLYWSASGGEHDGSVRRAALKSQDQEQEQVLASGINLPGQLRLVGDTLFWAEIGRWGDSPTAIKRIDLSQVRKSPVQPSSTTSSPVAYATQTVVHSNQSASIFVAIDYTGGLSTVAIQSFVVRGDGAEQKIWFVGMSAERTMFGKLVEITWKGSGDEEKAELKVLNQDTKDLGVPVGLEYVD
ncbi:hypothetical protein N0V83_008294 [Neocucurbitaria cava]|uniref:Uncharacterized protein n=1 Tax=Neocucurbitaria cava TaxID=798079 RepID=A0A9W9CJB2_9PLEO|nr:hypothetical protein N0V83_008294 [Neocucurbitaria cava]